MPKADHADDDRRLDLPVTRAAIALITRLEAETVRLREALDIACSREWSGYIHDYQRGHLSYHGMLKAKPLIWERVERNLREAKP